MIVSLKPISEPKLLECKCGANRFFVRSDLKFQCSACLQHYEPDVEETKSKEWNLTGPHGPATMWSGTTLPPSAGPAQPPWVGPETKKKVNDEDCLEDLENDNCDTAPAHLTDPDNEQAESVLEQFRLKSKANDAVASVNFDMSMI